MTFSSPVKCSSRLDQRHWKCSQRHNLNSN